jgi:hypothetical protein
MAAEPAQRSVIERLPGSAKSWDLAHIPETPADGKRKSGGESTAREELRILEPADKSEFVLTGEPRGDRIRVRSSLDAELPTHWYMDDTYLGVSAPTQPLTLALVAGKHVLACTTTTGVQDKIAFSVIQPEAHSHFGKH